MNPEYDWNFRTVAGLLHIYPFLAECQLSAIIVWHTPFGQIQIVSFLSEQNLYREVQPDNLLYAGNTPHLHHNTGPYREYNSAEL